MRNKNIYSLCLSAVFAAVIFVATAFLAFPLFAGYANFGDCFIILSGVILGPVYGPLASGIGAGLADLFAGYGIYAPATFVIKGLMSLAVYGIYVLLKKKKYSIFVCGIVAEIIMILGYFIFEVFLYGSGTA
ncbi:MAG: ECF transporter S component, partial [Acutalibacteraceae bacterium]